MSRPGNGKLWVALLGSIAILAGCENIPGFGPEPHDMPASSDESVTAKPEEPARRDVTRGEAKARNLPTPTDLEPADVKRLQGRLAELGFEPGPIDGIIGPRTTEAIKRYQAAQGLPAKGKVTAPLLRRLGIGAAGGAPEGRPSAHRVFQELPTYRPGTAFVYSNGDIDRVTKAEGTVTQWIRDDGTAYTTHGNFLLPWSHWTSDKERGTAEYSEAVRRLWPGEDGTEVAFSARMTVQGKDEPDSAMRWVERWRCRNEGIKTINVLMGTFETLELICRRGTIPGAPELVRTWYYAKDVRHYVRFVESDAHGKRIKSTDLLSVRPGAAGWPPIARAALARTIAHALDTAADGSRIDWSSSGVNTRVAIEPKSRFISDDDRLCRRFVQVWSENGRSRDYPAVACKNTRGRWQIPGVESDAQESLATASELL